MANVWTNQTMLIWVVTMIIQSQWKRPWHTCCIAWIRIRINRTVTKWCPCHRWKWNAITFMRRVTSWWTVQNWTQRKQARQKQNWVLHNLCIGITRVTERNDTEFWIWIWMVMEIQQKCSVDFPIENIEIEETWKIKCEWNDWEWLWRLNEQMKMKMSKHDWI